MKITSVLRIGIAALTFSIAARALYLQSQSWQQESLTRELCHLVGNYLETSAQRSAYEGMQQALVRNFYPDACVGVFEKGKNYAPDCLDPALNYHFTVCKVEGNKGIRAEINYPVEPFFNSSFFLLWLISWVSFSLLLFGLRICASYFARRITEELQERLFSGGPSLEHRGTLSKWVRWTIEKTGVLRGVQGQTQKFEGRLREYETRVRAEAALRAQKEAEARKSQEYFDKIEGIRHDIKSPLSALLALQNEFEGSELMRQTLSSSILGIHNMLDGINRTDKKDDEARLTLVEVVAEEAVVLLQNKFESSKGVSIALKYDSALLSPVMATSEGLKRVLDNLLENSFDAVVNGGIIQITIQSDESHCKIVVEDDGCGIPSEFIPKLFDKGATHGKVNGTGRGLYQCKKSIEAWNGKIEFTPLERGTRFTITLPRLQVGVAYVGLPRTKRLWVIDDDPTVSQCLVEGGYDVIETALTYDEGLMLFKKPIPEDVAVLVDFRLDDVNKGTDLIAGRKGLQQIFLCTNDFENTGVVQLARQIGVNILPKPLCFLAEPEAR